jgi:RNA polymerase sigma-70 factor (ECF subfamily)
MVEAIKSEAQKDRVLVRAFLAKDKSAFDKLVLKYQNKIFNLGYRLLGDYEEANDCAQEVFIKVYRSLKNFRFDSAFSTWLYRITVNTCKNKMASLQYRYNKKTLRLDNPRKSVELGDTSHSPPVVLERKEKERFIQKAINTLPEEQKTVVVLRDIEGLSYEEIANITGYNLGTVKSKLARARQQLRKKLKGIV